MRIKTTDIRERLCEQLRKATNHQYTSQAFDAAARYYVRMYGDPPAQPTGVVGELFDAARDADSGLTESEIAEILDTPELAVGVEVTRRRLTTPAAATNE